MSVYHFHAQVISRKAGRSSVAAAAYRSGEKMVDKHTGVTHDYRKRKGVFHSEIMLPPNAPAAFLDRETLWQEVEKSEKRKDSQVAREINIALPSVLTHEQQIKLAQDFVNDVFVKHGMIADLCVHDLGEKNPHFHVMLTTRNVDESGFTTKNRDWNERDLLKIWREKWADYANFELEKHGHDERIDHRTLAAQGIDREPQIHYGPARHAIKEREGEEALITIEPQRERQRASLKRAAENAVGDKIAEANLYATSGYIEYELEELEQELQAERTAAAELRARITALGELVEEEEAAQQRLERDVADAQQQHDDAASTVTDLEQYLNHIKGELESRGATNSKGQDAIRNAESHIRKAKEKQQQLEQDLKRARVGHGAASIRHEAHALGFLKRRKAIRGLEEAIGDATGSHKEATTEYKEAQRRSPAFGAAVENIAARGVGLREAIARLEETAPSATQLAEIKKIQEKLEKSWRDNGRRYFTPEELQAAAVNRYLSSSSGSSSRAPTPAPIISKPKG